VLILATVTSPISAVDQTLEFRKIDARLDNYGYVSKNHLWPSNIVSVCWENPTPDNARQRLAVEVAVEQSWELYAGLAFSGWGNACIAGARGIHIFVADEQPRSLIGSRLDGVTRGVRLNFSFGNWGRAYCGSDANRDSCIKTVGVHEFGHVLGLIHESLRSDAPTSCKDSYVVTSDDSDPGDGQERTPYDPESIMNYCNLIYGKQTSLSALDKVVAQVMYPKPSAKAH
jgi:hypothetical protein